VVNSLRVFRVILEKKTLAAILKLTEIICD